MANNVDEKVVRMTFDNQKFESNVKTTMSTLDKLKQSLSFKGASKGFDEINAASKRVDLSHTSNEIEKVKLKFSSLQVVGATVLSNMTTSAMQAGRKLTSALTNSLVQGGIRRAMNIEQAKFQLSGLGVAWESVEEDINYAVEGTAYGLDVAAKAASQFSASGIQAGDSMKTALRSISGVAAMTNTSYEEISRIFTSIAGQNRVMGNDLLQLSGRGINAAATLGKYLNKTEGEVREMVSKGQIDFATFAAAMDSAFGEHAKDANKTFSGALANMKAALSRIGADVATPALDNLRDIFNALRVTINDIHKDMKPFIKDLNDIQTAAAKAFVEFIDLGGLKAIIEGIGNIFRGLWSVIKPIQEGFASIFPTPSVQQVVDMANAFRDLTANLYLSEEAVEAVRSTFAKVAEVIRRFFQALQWGSDSVKKFLSETGIISKSVDGVSNAILDFILGVTNGVDIAQALTGLVEGLGSGFEFLGRILTLLSSLAGVVASAFTGAISSMNQAIANLIGGVGTGAQSAVDIFFKIFEMIPEGIARIIAAIGNGLKTILEAVPIHEINAAVQDTLFTVILAQISKFITGINKTKNELTSFFDEFKGITEGVKNVLEGVQGSLQSFATSIKINALVKIALAVTLLAVSLKMLSEIPIEQLGASLGILAGGLIIMGLALGGISILMNRLSGASKDLLGLNDITVQLIKVSISIAIFAGAIKMLSESMQMLNGMSWGDIIKGVIAIAGMAGVLIAASRLMSNSKGLIKTSFGLIVFSKAMQTLSVAIKSMDGVSWETIAKGLISIASVVFTLIGSAKLLEKSTISIFKISVSLFIFAQALTTLGSSIAQFNGVETASIVKAITSIIVLVGALAIMSRMKIATDKLIGQLAFIVIIIQMIGQLAGLIKQFNDVSIESLQKFTISLASFFGVLSLFVRSMGDKQLGKFLEISGGMWGITEAIRTFANGVKDFASMSTEDIAKGLISIVVGLKVLTSALDTIPDKKVVATAASFMILAVAINAIAKSVAAFGGLSFKEIIQGLAAVIITTNLLVKSFNSISAENKKLIATAAAMLVFSIALSALVGPLKTLGAMPTEDMAKSLIALAASLAIVNIASKALGKILPSIMKTAGSLVVLGASLIVFGLGLTAIAYPLKMLGEMDSGKIESGAVGLAAVLGALYAMTTAMNSLPSISVKTVAKLAVMTIVIAGVGAVLGQLSSIDATSALESSIAISAVLLSASGALAILGLVPLPAALVAIASLAAVIAGISAIVAAMGGIAQIPGVKWIINEGAALMRAIGEAIGGLFGGIAGGAINAVGAALPGLGQSLARFSVAATPFFSAMSNMDSNALQGVKSLAEMILLLTAANVLNSLTSWFTGGVDLAGFARQLIPFGQAMQAYASTVAGLDAGAITASANAGKALGELANSLPTTGGVVNWFMGEHDMTTFARQIVPFGNAIKEYSLAVAGLDESAIVSSANAAKALTDLVNSLPQTGGIFQEFTGDHDMVAFTQQLVPFGAALLAYSVSVKGLNANSIIASAEGAKAISELINSLPQTGGVAQFFTGEQNMTKFIQDLVPFGEALKSYSTSISGIDPGAIEASAVAGQTLALLVKSMPETGGVAQFFTGEHDMTGLIKNLVPFGLALKMYSLAVSGIDPTAISNSTTAGKALVELNDAFPKSGGVLDALDTIFNGKTNVAEIITNLIPFGKAMKQYSLAIAGIDPVAVTASATAGQAFASLLNALPKEGGILQNISGTTQSLADFATALLPFGVGMKAYSMAIEGINPEVVTASATAGEALVSLAEKLPKEGGFLGEANKFFNGETKIEDFMANMTKFAEGMASYSEKVKDVNPDAVTNSANAGKALAELAKELPTDGGFFAKFDGTQMSMTDFGTNIVAFGESLAGYCSKLQDIDVTKSQASVEVAKGLTEVSKNISEDTGTKLTTLANSLPTLGTNFLLFQQRVSSITPDITTIVQNTLTAVVDLCHKIPESINTDALSQFAETLKTTATDGISGFATSISDNTYQITDAVTNAMNSANDTVNSLTETVKTSFQTSAETSISYYNTGITNKEPDVITSITKMVQHCVSELNKQTVIRDFEDAGKNAVLGYARGFSRNDHYASEAAREMASKAMEAVKQETEEQSPSKAYMRMAKYNVLGYVKGFEDNTWMAESSARDSAHKVMFAFQSTVNKAAQIAEENLTFSPTITPVIDLSNAEVQSKRLNSMLSGNYVMPVDKIMVKAQRAIPNQNGTETSTSQSDTGTTTQMNFVQNNYSPKALSRVDIYRQTRNQFAMAKGVLKKR